MALGQGCPPALGVLPAEVEQAVGQELMAAQRAGTHVPQAMAITRMLRAALGLGDALAEFGIPLRTRH